MSSFGRASMLTRACVTFIALFAASTVSAQEEVGRISGLSVAGQQSLSSADGASVNVGPFYAGTYKAPAQSQLMATLGDGAAVLVVDGPTDFGVAAAGGGVAIDVTSGRVTLSVAGGTSGKFAVSGGTANKIRCDAVPAGVIVAVTVDAQSTTISFESGAESAKLAVMVGEKTESLVVGEAISVTGGAAKRIASEAYNASVAEQLSLGRAQTLRVSVDKSLFEEIVGWDRFAGAEEVKKNLPASRTTPEVRQVAVTVSSVNVVPARGGVTRPEGTIGANQVPIISPASLVVQAGADGAFTVVTNNRLAATNLTLTGSQGLGFGGSAALSIQGLIGGFRFVGPAGLGGR